MGKVNWKGMKIEVVVIATWGWDEEVLDKTYGKGNRREADISEKPPHNFRVSKQEN